MRDENRADEHFHILSLNGGGVRGIFQAVFLANTLEALGAPATTCFDLIAGTSTGAIVGLALSLGVDPNRIVDFYRENAPKVFSPRVLAGVRRGPRYSQVKLREYLDKLFGTKRLSDAGTKIIVPAVSLERFSHHVFSNITDLSETDGNLLAVDVALASAAAPTYFQPVTPVAKERAYVDGGFWANSPASIAILYANKYLGVPLESMRLLSVGTGDFPKGATTKDMEALRPISIDALRAVFEMTFSAQASFADQYAKELLGHENVVRISPSLTEVIPLDQAKNAIEKLPALAEKHAQDALGSIKKLLQSDADGRLVPSGPIPRIKRPSNLGFFAHRTGKV